MKHVHHIIPKHMGGNDDPTNLIELTVAEHAAAHLKLYQEHGHEEDRIAWQGLAGIINNEEATKAGTRLGRVNANKRLEERYGPTWRTELGKMGGARGHKNPNKKVSDADLLSAIKSTKSTRAALRAVGLHETGESNVARVKRIRANFGISWIFTRE